MNNLFCTPESLTCLLESKGFAVERVAVDKFTVRRHSSAMSATVEIIGLSAHMKTLEGPLRMETQCFNEPKAVKFFDWGPAADFDRALEQVERYWQGQQQQQGKWINAYWGGGTAS
jgi:hypothetical protein